MDPLTGQAVKSGVGLATGALQQLQAFNLKKKADAAFPDQVDPNQASFLAELGQKRRSIETGADVQAQMNAADDSLATASDAITTNAGGNSSAAIQGILQAQANAGITKNQALAGGQARQFNYDTAYGQLMGSIAARKLQLQLARSSQLRAEWDRKSKLASANLQAGLAAGIPTGGGNGSAPGSAVFSGASDGSASMAGKPADTSMAITPDAAEMPSVVPKENLATKSLGPLISLIK